VEKRGRGGEARCAYVGKGVELKLLALRASGIDDFRDRLSEGSRAAAFKKNLGMGGCSNASSWLCS
jgi:hypothetical protein